MFLAGRLKTRDRKTQDHQKCRGGKRRTGKRRTIIRGWKTRDQLLWNTEAAKRQGIYCTMKNFQALHANTLHANTITYTMSQKNCVNLFFAPCLSKYEPISIKIGRIVPEQTLRKVPKSQKLHASVTVVIKTAWVHLYSVVIDDVAAPVRLSILCRSHVFQSCIFHPCHLVPGFPVPQFPVPHF